MKAVHMEACVLCGNRVRPASPSPRFPASPQTCDLHHSDASHHEVLTRAKLRAVSCLENSRPELNKSLFEVSSLIFSYSNANRDQGNWHLIYQAECLPHLRDCTWQWRYVTQAFSSRRSGMDNIHTVTTTMMRGENRMLWEQIFA